VSGSETEVIGPWDLPEGWVWTTLGTITSYVQRGKGPKYTLVSELPVINQKCVRWWGVDTNHLKFVAEDQWAQWSEDRFLRDRDILWNSTGTGTIGRAALFRTLPDFPRVVVDSHVTILRTVEYNPSLLYRWIQSPAIQSKIDSMQTGSTNQVELSKAEILATLAPLPPLNEQKRIVAKIDALTEKSREAREALEEVPVLLDKLRQSILAAAFRGDLTREWRAKNPDVEPASVLLERIRQERRKKWEEAQLAKFQAKGKLPKDDSWKKKYVEPQPVDTTDLPDLPEGWCWASLEEITGNYDGARIPLKREDRALRRGSFDYYGASGVIDKIDDYIFDGTYLLVAEDGANLLSRSTPIAFIATGRFWVNNHAHVLRTHVIPEAFLMHYLNGRDISPWVSGTAQPKLNQKNMERIPVPLSPGAELPELLSRVENCLRLVSQQTTTLADHDTLLARLDSAILAKAFRGELVPQDPNDEPASVLLERIAAERATAEPTGKKPRSKRAK
jgi:type I restriction enzyme S subunit